MIVSGACGLSLHQTVTELGKFCYSLYNNNFCVANLCGLWKVVSKVLFLYFNLCLTLKIKSDKLSCSFISISFFTNLFWNYMLNCYLFYKKKLWYQVSLRCTCKYAAVIVSWLKWRRGIYLSLQSIISNKTIVILQINMWGQQVTATMNGRNVLFLCTIVIGQFTSCKLNYFFFYLIVKFHLGLWYKS
jgi:hypothetical protein